MQIEQIKQLIEDKRTFALFRLPWSDECQLVIQHQGEALSFSNIKALNGQSGFVLCPFILTKEYPLLLIRPDEHISFKLPSYKEKYMTELPVTASRQREEYTSVFHKFIEPLREGEFQKLVLSRTSTHCVADNEISLWDSFSEACQSYPRMMIYMCHTSHSGTWLGATPEILLDGFQPHWHTVALAGTMPLGNATQLTDWSNKNTEEQSLVSDYLRENLRNLEIQCTEKGPYIAQAGPLLHLRTDFYFALPDSVQIGDLLECLHPTPAVCGLPKEKALQFIPLNEGYTRGYYSGFIGMLNPKGETSLYVNLRCMKVEEKQLTLFAGGGILPSSTEDTEWEETEQKMNTIRNILRKKSTV